MPAKSTPHVKGSKNVVSMTIDPDQCARLDALVTLRRTSRAALLREAIDSFLSQNSHVIPMLTAPTRHEQDAINAA